MIGMAQYGLVLSSFAPVEEEDEED